MSEFKGTAFVGGVGRSSIPDYSYHYITAVSCFFHDYGYFPVSSFAFNAYYWPFLVLRFTFEKEEGKL